MKITEHLVFAALMVPTFVLLAATAVLLTTPEPQILTAQALGTEFPAGPNPF